jgi:DnaJ-class molecular chaperone
MSHAELCPVCKGSGQVQDNNESGTSIIYKTCHGCKGNGWIVVPGEPEKPQSESNTDGTTYVGYTWDLTRGNPILYEIHMGG